MKVCTKCLTEKPYSDFYDIKTRHGKKAKRARCKQCERAKAILRQNPDAHRASILKNKWGLTLERYTQMLEAQNGVCAICCEPETNPRVRFLSVDHDHNCCPGKKSCGKCLRKLLCTRCNVMIGMARDNPNTLIAGAEYLRG